MATNELFDSFKILHHWQCYQYFILSTTSCCCRMLYFSERKGSALCFGASQIINQSPVACIHLWSARPFASELYLTTSRTVLQHQCHWGRHSFVQCDARWRRGLALARFASSEPPWRKPRARLVDLRGRDPSCIQLRSEKRFTADHDWLCSSRCMRVPVVDSKNMLCLSSSYCLICWNRFAHHFRLE